MLRKNWSAWLRLPSWLTIASLSYLLFPALLVGKTRLYSRPRSGASGHPRKGQTFPSSRASVGCFGGSGVNPSGQASAVYIVCRGSTGEQAYSWSIHSSIKDASAIKTVVEWLGLYQESARGAQTILIPKLWPTVAAFGQPFVIGVGMPNRNALVRSWRLESLTLVVYDFARCGFDYLADRTIFYASPAAVAGMRIMAVGVSDNR